METENRKKGLRVGVAGVSFQVDENVLELNRDGDFTTL